MISLSSSETTLKESPLLVTQLGTDIIGSSTGAESGYSISMNDAGIIIAIGSPYINSNTGHVQVYQWNGSTWSQLGNNLNGEANYDFSGYSLSLSSSGSILAIGAWAHDGSNGPDSGHTKIYQWNGSAWTQLGNNIEGKVAGDHSGEAVSLSEDGTIIAIGAHYNDTGGYNNRGSVSIHQWNSSNWVQLGNDIYGEAAEDWSGSSVSLSDDGTIVAIGAIYNDGNGLSNSGHVAIHKWNGSSWNQLGDDINGENNDDLSSWSISISSDGTKIAIGAPYNDGAIGGGSGEVSVYQWTGSSWDQLGNDIEGETVNGAAGQSVALSDNGSILAIGEPYNSINGDLAGQVKLYEWDGYNWETLNTDINGSTPFSYLGYSVALSSDGSTFAAGAYGSNNFSGHVVINKKTPQTINSTITASILTAITNDIVVTLTASGSATGPGTDYSLSSRIITIPAGQTSGTIQLKTIADSLSDDAETVILDITSVTGASENGTQQISIQIDE